MESVLSRLFDYQKYDPSADLSAVIDEVHASVGMGRALSDDEADIWAAGEPMPELPDLPEKPHD